MSQIELITKALVQTFSQYCVNIGVNKIEEPTILKYNNLLFNVEIKNNKLQLKTKYLSPCMFMRHNLIEKYKCENDEYILEESGTLIDGCINFNSENNIPIDYMIIMKVFSVDKQNISSITIKKNNDEHVIKQYTNKIMNYLKNIKEKELKDMTNKSWNNYKMDGTFKVHNPDWKTADIGLYRLNDGTSETLHTKKIIDNINNDLYVKTIMCPDNIDISNCKNNEYYDKISGIVRYQGGVNLEAIFSLFGNSHILNQYFDIILRCNDENNYNHYGCHEADFQSIIIFNEFLRKYDQKTTLTKSKFVKNEYITEYDTNYNPSVFEKIYEYLFV